MMAGGYMQRSILVDLQPFTIIVFEYEQVIRSISDFSVGREGHRTPLIQDGSLSRTKRSRNHFSSRYPPPNGGAAMNWALFFEEDLACAFHEGSTSVPSHRCIHLIERDARWLFEWAGSNPVGLSITGPYPAFPVARQRLYSMGASNMLRAKVEEIQQALRAAGYDPGEIDGDFGLTTDQAVRAYQAANHLFEDGVIGEDTAAALGIAW
jgi:Putative peptidoglycan binding domain/L,D-transpeptidase catalytic domain